MADLDLAESHLLGWLSTVGLDAHYVRAEGDYLYRQDPQGREIPVVDFAGGYGSLMLGHNHPEIVSLAQDMLAGGAPVHAQFSRHPYATELAARLSEIVRRETGEAGTYRSVFANSGAEAVEIAVKHAELDRSLKAAELRAEIDGNIEAARAAAAVGTARLAPQALTELGLDADADAGADTDADTDAGGGTGIDAVVARIGELNAERAAAGPVLFALEGGFHGKLIGSVQLTHNPSYRVPFAAAGRPARFVPLDELADLPKYFEQERVDLLDLAVEGDTITLVRRALPRLTAFVLEPVQGEGGIQVLDADSAALIQDACARADVPIVIDEVQSGMGRTGTFLASTAIGLTGDYYTLAKSLGGGLAKTAVTLTRSARYRPQFELVHSSTFAKDYFSTLIGLKVLDLLEADDGAVYRKAAERGAYILERLDTVRRDFPDVVREVRGRGLMLGLEFHDQSGSEVAELREHAEGGTLGYALAGKLLRDHRVRTFPTASSPNTLRFEPSIHIGDPEVAQLEEGLREVCALLRAQDGPGLLRITPEA